jgi:hypothetical protein
LLVSCLEGRRRRRRKRKRRQRLVDTGVCMAHCLCTDIRTTESAVLCAALHKHPQYSQRSCIVCVAKKREHAGMGETNWSAAVRSAQLTNDVVIYAVDGAKDRRHGED